MKKIILVTHMRFYICTVVGLIIIFLLTHFHYTNELLPRIVPSSNKVSQNFSQTEIYQQLKDFTQDGERITSTSFDPWITIPTDSSYEADTLVINIKSLSTEFTAAQIFFGREGGSLNELDSKKIILKNGINTVNLPYAAYSQLRLDLAEMPEITMIVESVTFSNYTQLTDQFWLVLAFWAVLYVTLLYIFMQRPKELKKELNRILVNINTIICQYSVTKSISNYCSNLSKKKKAWLALGFLIFATSIIVYGYMYAKGNVFIYQDVGSDTVDSYFPRFNFLADRVRALDFSRWSHQNGPGGAFMPASRFLDPFSLIVVLAGALFGNQTIAYMLGVTQILKIFACGYLCYYFLSLFSFSEKSKVLSSNIFAFNGFIILWGQHYHFAFYPICAVWLLICVEKALRKPDLSIILTLTVAYLLMYSIYVSYMVLLCGVIYTIIRALSLHLEFNLNREFKACLKIASSFALGALISCVVALPSLFSLWNTSSRVQGASSGKNVLDTLLSSFGIEANRSTLLRFLSNNLQGIGNWWHGRSANYNEVFRNNYYEASNLFFTSFSLIIFSLFVYYVATIKNQRKRRLYLSAIFVILYILFRPLGALIFNGFVAPFARHTYLFMPFFAYAFAYVINMIIVEKRINLPVLFISACSSVFFIIIEALRNRDGVFTSHYLYILLIIIFTCVVLCVTKKEKSNMQLSYLLICCIVVYNVTYDSFLTTNARILLPAQSNVILEQRGSNNSAQALGYLDETDPSFYRTELLYPVNTSHGGDSLILDYNGLSMYNATPNKYLLEFYLNYCNDKILPYKSVDSYFIYTVFRSPSDIIPYSLLGVKYFLSKHIPQDIENYRIIGQFGDVYLLENIKGQQFSRFYENTFNYKEFLELDYAQRMNVITNALVIQESDENTISYEKVEENINVLDITHEIVSGVRLDMISGDKINERMLSVEEAELISTAEGMNMGHGLLVFIDTESLKSYENLYFEFSSYSETNMSINASVYTGEWASHQETLVSGKKHNVKYPLPRNTQWLIFHLTPATLADFKITSNRNEFNAEFIPEISDFQKDDHMVIDINNERGGYVFIPVPYQSGWSATLNGDEAEIIRANSGFMAIKVNAGENRIVIDFHTPMLNTGIMLSAIGVVLLAVIILFQHIKKKKIAGLNTIESR